MGDKGAAETPKKGMHTNGRPAEEGKGWVFGL